MYYHHFCNGLFQVLSKKMQVMFKQNQITVRFHIACIKKSLSINHLSVTLICMKFLILTSFLKAYPRAPEVTRAVRITSMKENNWNKTKNSTFLTQLVICLFGNTWRRWIMKHLSERTMAETDVLNFTVSQMQGYFCCEICEKK